MDKVLSLHWLFDDPPPFYRHVLSKWSDSLPGWAIDVVRGLDNGIPGAILELLMDERIPSPFRGDLFRYWHLYKQGGVYVDFDTLPGGRPMEDLLQHPLSLLSTSFFGCSNQFVDNSLMAAEPHHPFWREAIRKALSPDGWPFPQYWFCGANCYPSLGEFNVNIIYNGAEEVSLERATRFITDPVSEKGSLDHYFTHFRASKVLGIRGISTPDNPTWLDLYGKYPAPVEIDKILGEGG